MNGIFTHEIRTDTVHFKHARGVSSRSGKEFHIYHEIILFLDGNAELISENMHIDLRPNTLIVIPRETYHQVIIHGEQEAYYRCMLNFSDTQALLPLIHRSMNDLKVITVDRDLRYLFNILMETSAADHAASGILLQSVLAVLLNQIASTDHRQLQENHQNSLVHSAVAYINRNLCQRLTVEDIAKACRTSESSLAHTFKKEMNIPLHRYIIKKRLISAYHRISSGEPATEAAYRCGFQDYSGFYKQYKKMFGFSPSSRNR